MSNTNLSRREMLKLGVSLGAGTALPALAHATDHAATVGRPLRIAHLTDSHTQPERRAADGTIACLRHLQKSDRPVDLVITGGDLIMDAFEADRARTKLQWDLFKRILADECPCPIEHTLGNHDIWGWDKQKSGAKGDEPEYGKEWALETLGIAKPFRSFDRGAWHFVILDSVVPDQDGYLGRLDDEQHEWLKRDLAAVEPSRHVMVVSHIPILAACVLNDFQEKADKTRQFLVPGSWMMTDSRRVRSVLRESSKVRLCLSGHIHQLDRVDFEGITYICDGAVSGAWWKGPNEHCAEGYGLLDLYPDGRWTHQYMTYGWKAEPNQ